METNKKEKKILGNYLDILFILWFEIRLDARFL